MMNIKKLILGSIITLGMSTNVMAANINVSGVVFDPDSLFDWTSNSQLIEDQLDPGPDGMFFTGDIGEIDTLSGFGKVTGINGTFEPSFCPASCELTYEFGGITLASEVISGTDTLLGFTGGWINFFVDTGTAYDPLDKTTANDTHIVGGTPWLMMTGHATPSVTHGMMTTINATLSSFGSGADTGVGGGLLDAVGGLALAHFDTNGVGGPVMADMLFTTSFQPLGFTTQDGFELFGTADFSGDSIAVPEPSSIALFGLAILGIAGARRKSA